MRNSKVKDLFEKFSKKYNEMCFFSASSQMINLFMKKAKNNRYIHLLSKKQSNKISYNIWHQ